MNRTGIEYLTHTWNPIAMRCTRVSAGCANCWHLAMANRLGGNESMGEDRRAAYRGDGPPVLREDELTAPLTLRKPAVIGVQFMGDIFHDAVLFKWIVSIFQIMQACPQHTFCILTKRPGPTLEYLSTDGYPSSNIWLGVTAENQQAADERIPLLLQCSAAVRFVSIEPILSGVNMVAINHGGGETLNALTAEITTHRDHTFRTSDTNPVNWVIVGGETGPGARLAKLEWFYEIRDQCRAADVPLFVKTLGTALETQLGKPRGWLPDDLKIREFPKRRDDG